MKINLIALVAVLSPVAIGPMTTPSSAQTILVFEDFETGDFTQKGWYDGFQDQRTTN